MKKPVEIEQPIEKTVEEMYQHATELWGDLRSLSMLPSGGAEVEQKRGRAHRLSATGRPTCHAACQARAEALTEKPVLH